MISYDELTVQMACLVLETKRLRDKVSALKAAAGKVTCQRCEDQCNDFDVPEHPECECDDLRAILKASD
jgi:hypothetical protein